MTGSSRQVEDTSEPDAHLGFGGVTDSDSELLDRLRAGDEQAFAVLVRRYQPSLLRLACSLVDNRSVAEEAVQDTWMGVVRGIERFEGRSSVKTWLFRILVNRTRSAASRERRAEPALFRTAVRAGRPVRPVRGLGVAAHPMGGGGGGPGSRRGPGPPGSGVSGPSTRQPASGGVAARR